MLKTAIGVAAVATLCLTACAPYSPAAPGAPVASADLDFCRSEANRYRAMANRPALERSTLLDEYAATAAEYDGTRHTTHAYSSATHPRGDLLRFENEIPWWPVARYGNVRAIIRAGLATMWAEGPGGGHYESMTHPDVTEIGCGAYVGSGEVTVVQAFR